MLAARLVFSGILFLFITGLALPAQAATRFVDGAAGTDVGDCTVDACATIDYAVDQATGGDTIDIADSIYTEILTIDKSLIFQGESENGTIIQAHPDPLTATGRVMTLANPLDLSMADLTIRHGNASSGGGLYMNGQGDLTLARVTFFQNSAGGGAGGGLRFHGVGCTIAMTDVSFVENEALSSGGSGGGFNALDCDLITMNNVDLIRNSTNADAGGARMNRVALAQLSRVRLIENSTRQGGGMRVSSSVVVANDIEFRGNYAATTGGGLSSHQNTFTITNGLFSGNAAETGSSAIYVPAFSVNNLINVTVAGNRTATTSGAITYVDAGALIHNTIIWNNQNANGIGSAQASISNLNNNADVQNSLVQGYTIADLGGTGNLDGSINPLFTATTNPAEAPTTGGDLHLRENSPARDAGNNALIAGFDFDLDGLDRIFGGTVDLGPYEWGSDILFRDRFE